MFGKSNRIAVEAWAPCPRANRNTRSAYQERVARTWGLALIERGETLIFFAENAFATIDEFC